MRVKFQPLLIIIFIPFLIYSQDSDFFTKARLEKGSPVCLTGMRYFSQQNKFSYSSYYINDKDTIYFIIDNAAADSLKYILAYTSNNYLSSYNYLNNKKYDDKNVRLWGNVASPGGALYNSEIFWDTQTDSITFRFIKGSRYKFKVPAFTYLAKEASDIDLNFQLGLRDAVILMDAKFYNYSSGAVNTTEFNVLPRNLHLAAGISFLNYYKIDFRAGEMRVYEDFYGIEKGVFFQANIFKSFFYLVGGYDDFSNGGESHGVVVYSESGGDINFLCFGGGLNASKYFELDLIYYFPLNKVYGFNQVNYPVEQHYDKIVNGILNIGFQYSFIL